MESGVKIAGHPVHPMLVVFPLGLFATAVIFDVLYMIFGNPVFTAVSFYMIAAGIVGGLAAAIFGFLDWLGLPGNSRARSIGAMHGLGNLTIVILFAGSWLLRRPVADHVPGAFALILSFAGVALALVTGWLGGEMVYRLGVGMDESAKAEAEASGSRGAAEARRASR